MKTGQNILNIKVILGTLGLIQMHSLLLIYKFWYMNILFTYQNQVSIC